MNEQVKEQYLAHFGIKGQKWGVRRFQEEDGCKDMVQIGFEKSDTFKIGVTI